MAELKRSFLKGRMNKDLDERIIPNGEYRDALNIQVSTSEDSDVGSAQNIKGNVLVSYPTTSSFNFDHPFAVTGYSSSSLLNDSLATTVGTYVDNTNSKVYNFIDNASDLKADGTYNGKIRYTGVKSDVITEFTPSVDSDNKGTLRGVVSDVYEVRFAAETAMPSENKIIGLPYSNIVNRGGSSLNYTVPCVRVGMRVIALRPNGTDVWAGSEVYVTRIPEQSNPTGLVEITQAPVLLDDNYTDQGITFTFRADRILNFYSGILEEESNSEISPKPKTRSGAGYITGINVLGDTLYYTDGRTEPKKINIERLKSGTQSALIHSKFINGYSNPYNQEIVDLKEQHICVIKPKPLSAPKIEVFGSNRKPTNIHIQNSDGVDQIYNNYYYANSTSSIVKKQAATGSAEGIDFVLPENGGSIVLISDVHRVHWKKNDVLQITGQTNGHSAKVKITSTWSGSGATHGFFNTFSCEVITQDAAYDPSDGSETWVGDLVENNNIYENSFVSFAYRYKYLDNEYSAFSPYSKTAFRPGTYQYSAKDGFNLGMRNRATSIAVSEFVPSNVPEDVKEVELLMKDNGQGNVYSIARIPRHSESWRLLGHDLEMLNQIVEDSSNYYVNRGLIVVDEEMFGRTIDSNQLDRIFDAVPTTAKSQEFTANRLMYGNYTENYDLVDSANQEVKPSMSNSVDSELGIFTTSETSTDIAAFYIKPNRLAQVSFNNVGIGVDSNESTEEGFDKIFGGPNAGGAGAGIWPANLFRDQLSDDNNNSFVNNGTFDTFNAYNIEAGYKAPRAGYYTISAEISVNIKLPFRGTSTDGSLTYDDGLLSNAKQGFRLALVKVDSTGQVSDSIYKTGGVYNNNGFNHPIIDSVDASNSDVLLLGPSVKFGDSGRDGAPQYKFTLANINQYHTATVNGTVFLEQNERIACVMPMHPNFRDSAISSEAPFEFNVEEGNFSIDEAPSLTNSLASVAGKESVKSNRSYEVGVVYQDQFGRESTVLIDTTSQPNVNKAKSKFQNKIVAQINHQAPYWAESYKFYIKEVAREYDNLPLHKAYDNGDETHAWLAFASAEKDKVSKDDVLIAKKKHGDNTVIETEFNEWRILDISETVPTELSTNEGWVDIAPENENGYLFVKINADTNFLFYVGGTTNRESAFNNLIDDTKALDGAVFETKKKAPAVDLGFFYEVGSCLPIKLKGKLAEQYIKVGSRVTIDRDFGQQPNAAVTLFNDDTSILKVKSVTGSNGDQDNVSLILSGSNETSIIKNSGELVRLKFTQPDGSFVTAYLAESYTGGVMKIIPCTHPVPGRAGLKCPISLPWYNCFSFSNGVESDRIRDDFNANTVYPYTSAGKSSGFKASLEARFENGFPDYKREHKPSDIIFSQVINQDAGINRVSEFLIGKPIVKRLNPEYGSIQKLFTRDSNLLAFCESKVVKILANKDALFNADGTNITVISADGKPLGYASAFAGDYGIAKNPESFAADEYRCYFVDRNQGSVIRLSMDGMTPISSVGMVDWFNDHLEYARTIIGSFDDKKNEYNIVIHDITQPYASKDMYTLSYHEPSDGWVSFKSFTPEAGCSLNNRYYTFEGSKMWVHHSESSSDVLYNNFYGQQYTSTIMPIFNDAASSVKSFNTINYEGTQAKIDKFATETVDGVQYTDGEYYNLTEKKGWSVESIVTDQQDGIVSDFKDKEGKWFNKITGVESTFTNAADAESASGTLDFKEFSVQGIGEVASITGAGGSFGYEVSLTINNSSSINATFTGLTLSNQTSLTGAVLTATITPSGSEVVRASDFSTTSATGTFYTNVAFVDTTEAGAPDNTVEVQVTTTSVTLSSAANISIDVTGQTIPEILLYETQFLLTAEEYGSVMGIPLNSPRVSVNVEYGFTRAAADYISIDNPSSNAISLVDNIQSQVRTAFDPLQVGPATLFKITITADDRYFLQNINSISDLIVLDVENQDSHTVNWLEGESTAIGDEGWKTIVAEVRYTPNENNNIHHVVNALHGDINNSITISALAIKDETSFLINAQSLNPAASSGSFAYETNNVVEEVTSNQDWLTITGFDSTNVYYSVSINSTGSSRSAQVSLFSAAAPQGVVFGNSHKCTVTQSVAIASGSVIDLEMQFYQSYSYNQQYATTSMSLLPYHDSNVESGYWQRRIKVTLGNEATVLVNNLTDSNISISGDASAMFTNTGVTLHPDYPNTPIAYYNFTVQENTTSSSREGIIQVTHPDDSSITDTFTVLQLDAYNPTTDTVQITSVTQYSDAVTIIPVSNDATDITLHEDTTSIEIRMLSSNGIPNSNRFFENSYGFDITSSSGFGSAQGYVGIVRASVKSEFLYEPAVFKVAHMMNPHWSTNEYDDVLTLRPNVQGEAQFEQPTDVFNLGSASINMDNQIVANVSVAPSIGLINYEYYTLLEGTQTQVVSSEDQYPGTINEISLNATAISTANPNEFKFSTTINIEANTTPNTLKYKIGVWAAGKTRWVDPPSDSYTIVQDTVASQNFLTAVEQYPTSSVYPLLENLDYGLQDTDGIHDFTGDSSVTGYSYTTLLEAGLPGLSYVVFNSDSNQAPTIEFVSATQTSAGSLNNYSTTAASSNLSNLGTESAAGGTAWFATIPNVQQHISGVYFVESVFNSNLDPQTLQGARREVVINVVHPNGFTKTKLTIVHGGSGDSYEALP